MIASTDQLPGGAPDSSEEPPADRSQRIFEVGLGLVGVVAAAVRLPRTWTVLGDNALMRMWTDAVGTVNTPLVGGDARFGWNHLGPWVFYFMAIPYRLLGRSAVGLLVGAAMINIMSLIVILRCVRCLAGQRASLVVAAGTLVFLLTARGNRLIDPWNPYVVQLPFLLAMVSCWAVLNRHWRWLPWLVGAGSLSVQGHITFLAPVAVLFVVAAISVVRAPRSDVRSTLRWTGVVAATAWLPAVLDMFMPEGHNLFRVARFFAQPSGASTGGLSAGLHVVLRETGLGSSWLGGHVGLRVLSDGFDGGLGLLPGMGIVVLVAAGVIARRRRDRVVGSLVLIVALLLPVAVVEMAAGRGSLYPYLFGWVTLVGMMCWGAGLLALLPTRDNHQHTRVLMACVTIAALTLVVTGFAAGLPRTPRERTQDAAIVRQLVADTKPGLMRGADYQLDHGFDSFSSIYEMGVVDRLRHDGYRITVEPRGRVLFGRHMIDPRACTYPTISIVAPYESISPGDRILALNDPLSPAERAQEAELVSTLATLYEQRGSPTAADIVRFAEGDLVLIADDVHPDPSMQPRLQQLASLRTRGRSIAVVLHDPTPSPQGSCDPQGHSRHRTSAS